MAKRPALKYTIKRPNLQEVNEEVETTKRITQPKMPDRSIVAAKKIQKKCPEFPVFEIKIDTDYNLAPMEQRLGFFADELLNAYKKKVIEIFSDYPELKSGECDNLNLISFKCAKSQIEHFRMRKRKEEEVFEKRKNLAQTLMKENEIWRGLSGIYKINPRDVNLKHKIQHMEKLEKRLNQSLAFSTKTVEPAKSLENYSVSLPYDKEFNLLAEKVEQKRKEKINSLFSYAQAASEAIQQIKSRNAYNALSDFYQYMPIIQANPMKLLFNNY